MEVRKEQLCGCGSCDDAMAAATRLFKQSFKPDGEFCGAWAMAVMQSLEIITKQAAAAWASSVPGWSLDRAVRSTDAAYTKVGCLITSNMYKSDVLNESIRYTCEELWPETTPEARAFFEAGPPERVIAEVRDHLDIEIKARHKATDEFLDFLEELMAGGAGGKPH